MTSYSVSFAPKSKKVCAYSFRVQADTPEGARQLAVSLMRNCGENTHQFKPPKVRPLTTAELLQSA